MYALDRNGSKLWTFTYGVYSGTSPAIGADDTIYIGSWSNQKLYAINPNGTEKWTYPTGAITRSSPAIGSDGTIYTGAGLFYLFALNPDGTEKWKFTANDHIFSSPAIGSDGTIFIGSSDYNLYAINPDGTEKWHFTTGYNIGPSSAAIDSDGTIYIGSHDYNLYAIGNTTQNQPPVANAGPDQTVNEGDVVHFDGTGSYATNGSIDSWEWDFDAGVDSDGDGNSSNDIDASGPTPTHVYGDDGVYNVTLTVGARVEGGDVVKVDQDCVFSMDSSGSMNWNDPMDLRIEAAQHYVDKMSPNDRAAVVDFDTDAVLVNGDHLNMNYATIKNNLDLIDSSGGTGISTGMNRSNVELRDYGDPTHVPVIILLTDAQNNDPIDNSFCLKEANISASMDIKIFTIGLTINGSIEEQLLRDIATITGGKYFPAPSASNLEAIYEEISIIVENQSTKWLFDTDTMQVTVNNVAPIRGISGIYFGDEGSDFTLTADASDPGSDDLTFIWLFEYGPTITNVYYNDGMGTDPYPSPSGIYPFNVTDTAAHTYGDDFDYVLTLIITDDDGGTAVYTTTITVDNVPPIITEVVIPYPTQEGTESIFRATARDFGSDDLTFEWDFGDLSPLVTNTYYNDGSTPDPYPSPGGIFPFTGQDTVSHTYGDDYNYPLTLTVTDDDGGVTTLTTTVTVVNVDPVILPFGPFTIDEGSSIDITGIATDPGSDDLTFTWEIEGELAVVNTYYNDDIGADPYPSPEGTYPFSITESMSHTYADDGNFSIILTVEDDDGGTTTYETHVLVNNVPPSITFFNHTIVMVNEPRTVGYWGHQCEVEEPYGDHTGILQEWVDNLSSQSQVFSWISTKDDVESIVQDGDASDMIVMAERQLMGVWLNVVSGKLHPATEIDMPNLTALKTVREAILEIENVILNSENRNELERVKDIADNINNGIGIAWGIVEFTATATDPGADDLTFHWDFGDGKSQENFYPNPGGIFPISATDNVEHSYFSQGTFTVTLTVTDDDGGLSVITQIITF